MNTVMTREADRRVLCVMFCTGLVCSSIVGQAPKGAKVASTAKAKCSGAWSGTVSYTRTQSQTDSKKVERVSARGYDDRHWEMKYDYSARVAVVEDPTGTGSSTAKATISDSFPSDEKIDAVEKNSCDATCAAARPPKGRRRVVLTTWSDPGRSERASL